MKIQVNSDNTITVDASLTRFVEGEVSRAVGQVHRKLTRVEVHLSDVDNKKTGQADKRCLIEVRPAGAGLGARVRRLRRWRPPSARHWARCNGRSLRSSVEREGPPQQSQRRFRPQRRQWPERRLLAQKRKRQPLRVLGSRLLPAQRLAQAAIQIKAVAAHIPSPAVPRKLQCRCVSGWLRAGGWVPTHSRLLRMCGDNQDRTYNRSSRCRGRTSPSQRDFLLVTKSGSGFLD